jgi:tRNA (cytidine/uridine-2'-O-)-methyltransferase
LPNWTADARESLRTGRTLHVVLFEPEIPHNTGAVARLCAATDSDLHLVGRLGFRLDDAKVKRAGLDYWPHVRIHRWMDLSEFEAAVPSATVFALSTKGNRLYTECDFVGDCALVFGSESRGLPPSVVQSERCFRIPMLTDRVRSLNLATAVGIVLFEALRQQGFGRAGGRE